MSTGPGMPDVVRDLPRAVALAVTTLMGEGPAALAVAVDAILGGGASRLIRKRVETLLDDLREEFVRIVGTEQPAQYLESQDFAHLVIIAVQAAANERQRKKIQLFARLLAKASTDPWGSKADRVEEVLRSIAELSEAELVVLRAVISLPGRSART